MKKMLIVYYSLSNGNTKRIAEELQQATGANIARIDTVAPYTGSYDDIVSQGNDEVQRGYMPKIKDVGVQVADYDIIAIGTPTWWYTMAPAVKTFLHNTNFAGKTVIPFMTNGGWPGHVIKDIKAACKGATFKNEMEIKFDSTGGPILETSQKELDKWIANVKGCME